jgi:signal transduction histidine kinase
MMFLGLLFLGILYTHRIAGPLYRVKVAAKSIGNGYIGEKIKLRRKDVIHSFAECVNDLTGTYSDKVKLLKSDINQLKDSVNELKNLPDDKKSLDSNVKKISDINGHINSLIENIKI